LIAFGAFGATSDPRKGFDLLKDAFRHLASGGWRDKAEAIVLGASSGEELGLRTHYLGRFQDEITGVIALSAADIAVFPSRQENLSNMIAESLSCGIPCVAFDIGGNGDLITPGYNGNLVQPFDTAELAASIDIILRDDDMRRTWSNQAREGAEAMLSQEKSASRYVDLFAELVSGKTG